MASFKHYLPAATGSEQILLEELGHEHPRHLLVHARRQKEACQIFFETDSQSLAGWVWYLLARLKSSQRRVEELYLQPDLPRRSCFASFITIGEPGRKSEQGYRPPTETWP